MSKRALLTVAIAALFGLAVLAAGILPVYAHCGKCLTDAKHFASSLEKNKMTLAAASTLAEVETKGVAVHTGSRRTDKGLNIEVHCLAGGEILAVVIDGQTGKVVTKKAVKDLEVHAE